MVAELNPYFLKLQKEDPILKNKYFEKANQQNSNHCSSHCILKYKNFLIESEFHPAL